MSNKLQIFLEAPIGDDKKPKGNFEGNYIPGTEAGHFYLVTDEGEDGVVGFRPLSLDAAPKGTSIVDEEGDVRVRVVPFIGEGLNEAKVALLATKGFTEKGDAGNVHYSETFSNVNEAQEALDFAVLVLNA